VSGANDSAAVSGANDSAAVSGANDPAAVSGANVSDEHKHEPHIDVVKGQPTEEELAAVVAVLAAVSVSQPEPREQEENLWGHPVDRLRYTTFSWQRVTLLERTHMRK
jgi:Acyl-CoA carboxylase epsilon subunit